MLELSKDPAEAYFRFADVVKILPYSDQACPPDGFCSENLQASLKMRLSQGTKPKGQVHFFHLHFKPTATEIEVNNAKELVLKNETLGEL